MADEHPSPHPPTNTLPHEANPKEAKAEKDVQDLTNALQMFQLRSGPAPLKPKSRRVGGQGSASERNTRLKVMQNGIVLVDGALSLARTPGHLVETVKRNAATPLLRIPPELRNRIWKFALQYGCIHMSLRTNGQVLGEAYNTRGNWGALVKSASAFHLPTVSRQIYAETATLVYSLNIFRFESQYAMHRWAESLLSFPHQRHAVTAIAPDDCLSDWYLQTAPTSMRDDEPIGDADWVESDIPEPSDPLFTWYFPALQRLVITEGSVSFAIVVAEEMDMYNTWRMVKDYKDCIERKVREREGPKGGDLDIVFSAI